MANDILVRLRLKAEEFSRGVKSAFNEVPDAANKAGQDAGDEFAAGFRLKHAAIIGAVTSGALLAVQAVKQSLDLAADLAASSAQLGINVEVLQEYRYAATQAGIGVAELDDNVGKLTLRLGEANAGGRTAQQAFVDLGVGFKSTAGDARATEAVFIDVVQRLSEIADPSERARLGTQLLGEQYAQMEPLVRGGAAGLAEASNELRTMSAVLSAEEIQNLNETNAKFEQLKNVLSVSVAQVVADNADSLIAMADALGYVAGKAIEAAGAMEVYYSRNRNAQMFVNPVGAVLGFAADQWRANNPQVSDAPVSSGPISAFGRRAAPGPVADPVVDPLPTRRSAGRAASTGQTDEERARAQAIRDAERAEQDFEQAVQRSLQAQSDSVRVEEVRKQLGDAAAAAEEARLNFQRQNPLAVNDTVEALTAALGITRELTLAEREHFQNLVNSANAAEDQQAAAAAAAVEARARDQAKRDDERQQQKASDALKQQVDEQQRAQEDAVREVADLYANLFSGNTDKIWRRFKQQGIDVLADLAAQWTLSLLSGQSAPGGGNPLSAIASIFGSSAQGPANDNGIGGAAGAIGSLASLAGKSGGIGIGSSGAQGAVSMLAAVPGLGQALAISAITAGIGEGIEKVTGLRYDMLGGLFGGLVGGFAIGALKGAVKGSASIGSTGSGLGVVDSFGKKKFKDAAIGDATGVVDTLSQIADALGIDLNSSVGAVSIGTRNGKYRVDPTGGGALKPGKGAIDFGQDQQAAIEYAIRNLIEDGVLTGISQASQNILKAGGDLQAAIEKAVMIESVPKLLKQRLDPLGAALDTIDEKFRDLAAALKEGGASAQQVADARRLWQLERDDAVKQIGEASANLKSFLQSLMAGPNSPLSLRQQKSEAEAALAPYVAAIEEARTAQAEVDRLKSSGGSASDIASAQDAARAAAAAIDQSGFQEAAQLLLGITRQTDASGTSFFATFDRIRALTGGAIGAIDSAASSTAAGSDPFAELTARNTGDIAAMLADTNRLLQALNDNATGTDTPGNRLAWLQQNRAFTT